MNQLIAVCALLASVGASAQDSGRMDQQDIQKMMEQAQEMQACMQKIDPNEFEKLLAKAEAMEAEVHSLCNKGERIKALSTAISRGRELRSEPVMQVLQECSGMLQQQVPALAWKELGKSGAKNKDICDSM